MQTTNTARRKTRTAGAAGSAALLFLGLTQTICLPLSVLAVTNGVSAATPVAKEKTPPLSTLNADGSAPRPGGARRTLQAASAAECGVTGGCETLGTCNDEGYEVDCAIPDSYACEHQMPGLSICESPPLSAMLPCWMSEVDGALRLNQISLPGTHDTMAKGMTACLREGLANHIHTQAWSLRTMLDAGVRAIDIRLRRKEDLSLVLEHGVIELPYNFDADVRDVLASFLGDNPTETVLMLYQINDLAADSASSTAEETLWDSMSEYPDLWLDGDTVPTLDEARGKVVLPAGMPQEEQNEYDLVDFEGIPDKKAFIRDFFSGIGASGVDADGPLRLNYLSGTGTYVYPLTVAAGLRDVYKGTNEVVFEFSGGCLGVVLFDFVGEDAIAHVVAQQGTTGPSWDPPAAAAAPEA
ncbi:unnamed protein product [Scytosiphon promiscuus]